VTITGITGASQPVTFDPPTVTGGAVPVDVTCTPASGSTFSLGTTPVTCSARDAQVRQAACSFSVSLKGLTLGVKRFGAYGDSLTEGQNGIPPFLAFVDTPNAYPTKLQARFDETFPGQGIVVINRGQGGQTVERARDTLPGFLAADRPDAVLLLTGYNNLTEPCAAGSANSAACEAAIETVAFGVRDCIREVKESPAGVRFVFVSTLTPPGPSGRLRIDSAAIVEVNGRIRQMIAQERVTLADTYVAFLGHEAEYTSPDALHLLPAGYQAIADTFFSAIRATVPQTALTAR
jgi:lysophospholipase L1-like esterase